MTDVGSLPGSEDGTQIKTDFPLLIGDSYFKHCKCGKPHPREQLLKHFGTLHGQLLEGIAYLGIEDVGRLPQLSGQWRVVLVANDNNQTVWELHSMEPLPKDKWITEEQKWKLD